MTGGAGNDTYEVSAGNDTITDFRTRYFAATLSGANEVTPTGSTATGQAALTLNAAQTRLDLTITTTSLDWDGAQTPGTTNDNVNGFHVHNANAGTNGGIVWDIAGDADTVENAGASTVTSVWSPADTSGIDAATFINRLFVDGLYLNIHTVQFGGGAIRGQIDSVNGDVGADKIDLTSLNIGSLAAWQAVTADVAGSAKMTTVTNGVVSTLTITGVAEALFNAADFIFAGNVAQTINGTNNIDYRFGAGGNDTMNGLGGNDRLFGETGNDVLDGGTGADQLDGGAGDDNYALGAETDAVTDSAGIDTITSTITRSLAPFTTIENLTLLGTSAINGTGNALANTITGNNAANVLDGGLGTDILIGNAGNDTYVLGASTDAVTDTVGSDTITSTITRSLASFGTIEKLMLVGTSAINGTGNGLANTITGNGAVNTLDGGLGFDTLIGGGGNDTYVLGNSADTVNDTAGIDTITSTISRSLASFGTIENLTLTGTAAINGTGNGLDNTITGNAGANIIDGMGGIDTMIGGNGSDTYTADLATDVATETNAALATGGDDLVNFIGTTGTFTLGANVERLTLGGTSAINGTGNALANTITGNTGANVINGMGGVDTMIGGNGSDTYTADVSNDVVTETNATLASGGNDLVNFIGTTGTFTLGANVERLTLGGTPCSRSRSRAEPVEEDPLDLLGEGGLEVADRGQRDPDARRDHRLVRAALGREAHARRRRRHDEPRARVQRVVERVEAARDERIVERADGQERRAGQLAREAEGAEGQEQVVLRDAELDVLAGRRFLPHDGLRRALDGPGLHARHVHALAIDPRREVRGHRHVGGERDDAIADGQAAELGQRAAEGLLARALRRIRLVEVDRGRRGARRARRAARRRAPARSPPPRRCPREAPPTRRRPRSRAGPAARGAGSGSGALRGSSGRPRAAGPTP